MNLNFFMAQALMEQAYSERLREAANERLWKKAVRAIRQTPAGRNTSTGPSKLVTA
jgi:hypothetical protein